MQTLGMTIAGWHDYAIGRQFPVQSASRQAVLRLSAEAQVAHLCCACCCCPGILPFGTMFIELYFAMTSLWLGYFYYLFGFVFLIGLLTIVINCEIAVLCTYVQLCAEDYMWW